MHNKHNNKILGFSLIELMVVIAIIGILTAVATPVYLSYTIKSKVAGALPILEALKNKASDYYTSNNAFPADTNINTPPYTDDLIEKTTVTQDKSFPGITGTTLGSVQVTFKSIDTVPSQLKGNIISLVAIDNPNTIIWKCISGDANGAHIIENAYLPSTCQKTTTP